MITPEIVREIFSQRLLYADLLKSSSDPEVAHAATMAAFTMEGIRKDLMDLIY